MMETGKVPKRPRGHQKGTPMQGKYGLGVRTKVVRVPASVAANIENILENFEAIKRLVDEWDEEVEKIDIKKLPRYDQARKLLMELREYL